MNPTFLFVAVLAGAVFFAVREKKKQYKTLATPKPVAPNTMAAVRYDPITGEVFDHSDSYHSLDDWKNDLTPLWSGSILATFTYHARGKPAERRSVTVQSVVQDGRGRVYLQGHCHLRDEQRTFNIDSMESDVLCADEHMDIIDFLYEKMGLEI